MARALDAAVSEWAGEDGVYRTPKGGKRRSREELAGYWAEIAERYPVVSLEDGMAEDDWGGWQLLTQRLGGRMQLVGDDLFVTNAGDAAPDAGGGGDAPGGGLGGCDEPPERGDGGCVYCGPGGSGGVRAD